MWMVSGLAFCLSSLTSTPRCEEGMDQNKGASSHSRLTLEHPSFPSRPGAGGAKSQLGILPALTDTKGPSPLVIQERPPDAVERALESGRPGSGSASVTPSLCERPVLPQRSFMLHVGMRVRIAQLHLVRLRRGHMCVTHSWVCYVVTTSSHSPLHSAPGRHIWGHLCGPRR